MTPVLPVWVAVRFTSVYWGTVLGPPTTLTLIEGVGPMRSFAPSLCPHAAEKTMEAIAKSALVLLMMTSFEVV